MKPFFTALALFAFLACNNDETTKETPAAVENATQHPNGVTSGAVISTDTASIAGDSSQRSRDSMPDKK